MKSVNVAKCLEDMALDASLVALKVTRRAPPFCCSTSGSVAVGTDKSDVSRISFNCGWLDNESLFEVGGVIRLCCTPCSSC